MKLLDDLSDDAVLKELGERIARYRLNRDMSQASLAKESGISLRTMTRIELGGSVQVLNLIRVMRALELLGNLEVAIPILPPSPVQMAKLQGKVRKRASHKKKAAERKSESWSWGEDE